MGSLRKHLTVGVLGVLAVGGVSYLGAQAMTAPKADVFLAQVQGGSAPQTQQRTGPAGGMRRGPQAGPHRPIRGDLVVPGAEEGTFNKVRIDRGIIQKVEGTTVVIKEDDGATVEVPTSDETRVARDGAPAAVGDLRSGDHAFALRVDEGHGLVTKGVRAISPERWKELQQRREECRANPVKCRAELMKLRAGRERPAA